MVRADEDRESERATHGVAPGALSALLEELAQAPAPTGADEQVVHGPRPGSVIGRFELQEEIGRGGFGVVYAARDRELRRLVAFKLVRPGRVERGEEQLRREADVIAQLSHPNLVTLFDLGNSTYGPYLVLELLRGETLEARLQRAPFTPVEAVRIAAEVARGLSYAHGQGVVHRDLKPSNVFLCQNGSVKLLDFGMSHAFGWRRVEGGTPAYMAPEQLHGAPEDERTDVYALGVLLYRMLAGELPFPRDPRVLRGDRTPPVLEVPGAPELGELVGRMLAPAPIARPRHAAEVGQALETLGHSLAGPEARPLGPVRTRRSPTRWPLVAALLATLAGAAAGAWLLRPAPPPPPRAIAVLPFQNRSDSPDAEYFSDGLADEIRNLLTRLGELKVAASTSSFHFKNRTSDVAEVAQKLRVDVVLEGTVRRDRDRLRVSAELVDARSGFRVWSQIYDRRLEDVFAIQDDIARRVAEALQLVLSGSSQDRLQPPRQVDLAAYDLYLKGRAALRLPRTPANLDSATAFFEQAIAADGALAQAHAGLCDTWLARYELRRATESFDRAEEACHRALERDADASEVYLALGNLHLTSGRYPDAEREFLRASALSQNSVDAVLGLAATQAAQRHPEAAEQAFARAQALDPGYWRVYQALGSFLFGAGRYAEAARAYGEVIALTPRNATAHNNLGAAHYMAGDVERAIAAWKASLELAPSVSVFSNLGSSYFFLGRFDEAAAMYRRAADLAPEDHRMWGNLGDAYTYGTGRQAEADEAHRRAVALGEARLRINPSDGEAMADVAHCLAKLGEVARARALREQALRADPGNMQVQYKAALVDARLGDRAAALGELEKAVALGYQRQLLGPDPGLAPLRGEPRFAALAAPGKR
ncbi:MAG: protein kinase [Deltaproteobacteria bacterium]|nr:protein kinase [Deltaproteobacteria bacterium]